MRLGWLGVLALLVPATARATTGLEWRFDHPIRYVVHARLELPQLTWLQAQRNHQVKVSELDFAVVTTCKPDETLGKRGWELACNIDDLALHAAPADGEEELVLPVLDDWDKVLTGATIKLTFTRDGQVKDIGLEHPHLVDHDQRTSEMVETMRELLTRVYAALDLQLPKNGDDKGHGSWNQRQTLVLGFPVSQGTMGSATVQHQITKIEAGHDVDLKSAGEGLLSDGEMVAAGGQERPADTFDMRLQGTARFDTQRGALVSRDYQTHGVLTASSVDAEGQKGYPWVQVVKLRLLAEGSAAPQMGPNEIVERVDTPPPSMSRTENAPPKP